MRQLVGLIHRCCEALRAPPPSPNPSVYVGLHTRQCQTAASIEQLPVLHVKYQEDTLHTLFVLLNPHLSGRRRRRLLYGCLCLCTPSGPLSTPAVPAIPGLEGFKGTTMHTATWDNKVELAGKKVTVVGTGASAVQAIPKLQQTARELVVFQVCLGVTSSYRQVLRSALSKTLLWLIGHSRASVGWPAHQPASQLTN